MPGGRLVEDDQLGLVDEGAGELEAALHPARQLAGLAAADIPQVDDLQDLADASPAPTPEHPEQAGDEVDVLAGRQVLVQGERLRHVADPLARRAAGSAAARGPGPRPRRSSA